MLDLGRDSVKILVAYICVSKGWRSLALASRFVSTWQRFPPEAEHKLVIVFNGGKPRRDLRSAFNPIPHGFHERSNAGWDIGAKWRRCGFVACDS